LLGVRVALEGKPPPEKRVGRLTSQPICCILVLIMIGQQEIALILERCRRLPPAKGNYLENDYVTNLLLTVLDYQLRGHIVEKAIAFFREKRRSEIRTADDLKGLLARYPDDDNGNTRLAQYLWGYRYWNRAHQLRELLAYFESIGVMSQEALRQWAGRSSFEGDFKGRIRGLGFAVYQWLVMRQGMPTIKPDVHVRRFVESIIRRSLTDDELVQALEEVARRLGLKAYELDWRIWEYQKNTTR